MPPPRHCGRRAAARCKSKKKSRQPRATICAENLPYRGLTDTEALQPRMRARCWIGLGATPVTCFARLLFAGAGGRSALTFCGMSGEAGSTPRKRGGNSGAWDTGRAPCQQRVTRRWPVPHVRFGGVARRSVVVLSTRERLRVRKRGGRRADSDLGALAAPTAAEQGAEFPPRLLERARGIRRAAGRALLGTPLRAWGRLARTGPPPRGSYG